MPLKMKAASARDFPRMKTVSAHRFGARASLAYGPTSTAQSPRAGVVRPMRVREIAHKFAQPARRASLSWGGDSSGPAGAVLILGHEIARKFPQRSRRLSLPWVAPQHEPGDNEKAAEPVETPRR
jgi:hypothetical protein